MAKGKNTGQPPSIDTDLEAPRPLTVVEDGDTEGGVIGCLLLLETDNLSQLWQSECDVPPLSGKSERLGRGSLEVLE